MAEMPKSHQQVKHRHVHQQSECRMDPVREPPHDPGHRDRRYDREHRGKHALPERTAIDALLDATNVDDERAIDRSAPFEGTPLLERERSNDREQVHRRESFVCIDRVIIMALA